MMQQQDLIVLHHFMFHLMRKISNNKTDLKTSFSEATQSVNLKNFL